MRTFGILVLMFAVALMVLASVLPTRAEVLSAVSPVPRQMHGTNLWTF
jgi:hypothetical protein